MSFVHVLLTCFTSWSCSASNMISVVCAAGMLPIIISCMDVSIQSTCYSYVIWRVWPDNSCCWVSFDYTVNEYAQFIWYGHCESHLRRGTFLPNLGTLGTRVSVPLPKFCENLFSVSHAKFYWNRAIDCWAMTKNDFQYGGSILNSW